MLEEREAEFLINSSPQCGSLGRMRSEPRFQEKFGLTLKILVCFFLLPHFRVIFSWIAKPRFNKQTKKNKTTLKTPTRFSKKVIEVEIHD